MTIRSLVLHCAMLRCTEETMASKNVTIVLEAIALGEQPCQILQRTPANALCVAVLVNESFPIGHHTHINMEVLLYTLCICEIDYTWIGLKSGSFKFRKNQSTPGRSTSLSSRMNEAK